MAPPPPIPALLWNTIPPEAQAAILVLVASLEQRIAELGGGERRPAPPAGAGGAPTPEDPSARQAHPASAATTPNARAPTAVARNIASTPGPFGPSRRPAPNSSNTTSIPSSAPIAVPAISNRPASSTITSSPISPNPRSNGIATAATSTVAAAVSRPAKAAATWNCPGSHIGPRARLLTCYSRAHLGISLGKTQNLLHDFFGLTVSRAGLLGHLRWGGQLFAPVVEELLELLRQSPVVQGDETGWRINGQTAWAWCFRDPRLALFLIDRHRSRDVIVRVLGESFAGTLVSDFYAAYNGLDCAKQRCLVHLLRELAKLREELPWQSVRAFIQPLIDLFQDAIQLGKDREQLGHAAFDEAYQRLIDRFDDLMLKTQTQHPDCVRIWKRLYKHCDELFTFLDDPRVPADNNGTERDIRSLAAARNDGGTHRADWSAAAFARIKSVIVTGMKNGVRFIQYGIEVVRAKLRGERLPLPLAATPDTS